MFKQLKKNNKGISLVELLIAMAVGSIVLSAVFVLITQGTRSYSTQTMTAQLQEEANVALNQMNDRIMEANMIAIANDAEGNAAFATHQTGGTVDQQYALQTESDGSKALYVNGALLCKYVKSFQVKIVQSGLQMEATVPEGTPSGTSAAPVQTIEAIHNPIQIQVTLQLEYGGVTRTVTRVTSVRNQLNTRTVALDGASVQGKTVAELSSYIVND